MHSSPARHPLVQLGFNVAGYGCATCIGNSGPLPDEVSEAIAENDMTVAAVLSGNRNFEGRVHAQVKANYLASPPLVVAYALAGTVNIDFETDPIGYDTNNEPVFLKDLWPTSEEIKDTIASSLNAQMFPEWCHPLQMYHVAEGTSRPALLLRHTNGQTGRSAHPAFHPPIAPASSLQSSTESTHEITDSLKGSLLLVKLKSPPE